MEKQTLKNLDTKSQFNKVGVCIFAVSAKQTT